MDRYVVLNKAVGETPLACTEEWRALHPEHESAPLAYAGRLDPMASGALLILIGDECKRQTDYHGLNKEYVFSVLFGVTSDTGDVLGRLTSNMVPNVSEDKLRAIANNLVGKVTFPYPHFSSKTVAGKPLHTWTLEGRLDEIEIPTITSHIYSLSLLKLETETKDKVVSDALTKIDLIPPVTDPRKALGNDFRRTDVRKDWNQILENTDLPGEFQIATFHCIASSGTYMRTLAAEIAKQAGTIGHAWHIHRPALGHYDRESNVWNPIYSIDNK